MDRSNCPCKYVLHFVSNCKKGSNLLLRGVRKYIFLHQSIIKLHVTIIVPSFQKMQQLDGRFLPLTETGLIQKDPFRHSADRLYHPA